MQLNVRANVFHGDEGVVYRLVQERRSFSRAEMYAYKGATCLTAGYLRLKLVWRRLARFSRAAGRLIEARDKFDSAMQFADVRGDFPRNNSANDSFMRPRSAVLTKFIPDISVPRLAIFQ